MAQLYVIQIIECPEDLEHRALLAMMRGWMTALVAVTVLATPPAASARWQATSDGAWGWSCGRTPRPRTPRWPTSRAAHGGTRSFPPQLRPRWVASSPWPNTSEPT